MSNIKHSDKKNLLSNFLSLTVLQAMNMLLPLITLPYIVRVVGVNNFGLLNFSLAVVMYFNILVSFGFDLSATREVSINRTDIKKISEIFFSVMIIKAVLVSISFIILSFLILFVDSFSENASLYYATFGLVIANLLFPSWFFQGMERMKYITFINVGSKIAFTILIFIVVQNDSDYIYIPILNSLGAIIGGLYSLVLIFKLFHIQFIIPDRSIIIQLLKDSFSFFLSRIANNGSRYLATTIIGIYFGNTIVGYYSMVEKLYYAFMSLGGVVSQTIYPYMSRTKNIIFFKKIFILIISVSIVILIPVIYFNTFILLTIFNIQDDMMSNIFFIVFSGSIFGIASALIGYPLLAAFGYINYANNSLIYASIAYVLFIGVSALMFKNIYLVSFSVVVYSFTALILRIYYIYQAGILRKKVL